VCGIPVGGREKPFILQVIVHAVMEEGHQVSSTFLGRVLKSVVMFYTVYLWEREQEKTGESIN
jgi:hypothetical protein